MTLTLPVGSLLFIDTGTDPATPTWTKLSEHNRAPLSVDPYRHEQTQRMANGSLRKLHIADKKTISTSWTMLPSYDTMTVDGGYGAVDLRTFYLGKGKGAFKVKISYNGVTTRDEVFTAFFNSCTFNVVKRNVKLKSADAAQEFWDVSISLEEI
jgi:hypothetical protein